MQISLRTYLFWNIYFFSSLDQQRQKEKKIISKVEYANSISAESLKLHLMGTLCSWSFRELLILFHCNYSMVNSDLEL